MDATSYQFKDVWVLVAQSCPALCNPIDCSSPGSSAYGIHKKKKKKEKMKWCVLDNNISPNL